jgi:ribosomal protein L7/L12
MKMIEHLFSSISGKIICYGINFEKYLQLINENEKITECLLINSITLKSDSKKVSRSKTITAKQINKKFSKNIVDYIVVNEEEIGYLEKKLIPIFIKSARNKIYLYNVTNKEKTLKRYKRYGLEIKEYKDYVEISNLNIKTNIIKNKIYYLKDMLVDLCDAISEFLTS